MEGLLRKSPGGVIQSSPVAPPAQSRFAECPGRIQPRMNRCRALLALVVLGVAMPAVIARDAPRSPTSAWRCLRRRRPGLPALPAQSPRNANYTIEARLDPERHTIEGQLVLEWRNTTGRPAVDVPVPPLLERLPQQPLDLGARAGAGGPPRGERRAGAGATPQVTPDRASRAGAARDRPDADPALRPARRRQRRRPHGHGGDDARRRWPPGATARFRDRLDVARSPTATSAARAGCTTTTSSPSGSRRSASSGRAPGTRTSSTPGPSSSPTTASTTSRLTVPRGLRGGRHGRAARDAATTPDGTRTFRFLQEDVHDFAWTASRRFLEKTGRFEDPGYPPVDIRLLVQPEHEHLAERYIEATRIALRSYGAWSAPYPYAQITVVDPGLGLASGRHGVPDAVHRRGQPSGRRPTLQSPESVTIHEAGHQFWYGAGGHQRVRGGVARRGLQQLPRREGLPARARPARAGASATSACAGRGAAADGRWWRPGVASAAATDLRTACARTGETDVMARRGVGLPRPPTPTASTPTASRPSACRPSRACVGDETMTRILRTYARRYRFAHPTSEDFIATVNEVTGQDWRWYFDQTWFSAEQCDYAVTVKNTRARDAGGIPRRAGRPRARLAGAADDDERRTTTRPFDSEVMVRRLGGVRLPVEVRVEFADGRSVRETWDGQYRWTRFRYRAAQVRAADVDPERQDRPRREPRQQRLGGRERAGAARGARSGRRAGCSGSRTCSSCTRCSDEDGRRWRDRRRACGACAALGPVRLPPRREPGHGGCSWPCRWPRTPAPRTSTSGPPARDMMHGFDYPWWSHWSDARSGWPTTLGPDILGTGFALQEPRPAAEGPAPRGPLRACPTRTGKRRAAARPAAPRPRRPPTCSCRSSWPAACSASLRQPRARWTVRGLLHGAGFYFGRFLRVWPC